MTTKSLRDESASHLFVWQQASQNKGSHRKIIYFEKIYNTFVLNCEFILYDELKKVNLCSLKCFKQPRKWLPCNVWTKQDETVEFIFQHLNMKTKFFLNKFTAYKTLDQKTAMIALSSCRQQILIFTWFQRQIIAKRIWNSTPRSKEFCM